MRQGTLSFYLVVSLLGALVLPVVAFAQTTTPVPETTEISDQQLEALQNYFDERSQCLSEYQFGSVLFDIPGNAQQTITAGQSITLQATLENTNPYPLTEGRVYAHVLRQDSTVAADHWHPLVFEGDVPGDFSLSANEKKPFTFTWQTPSQAPAGVYRVELYYLAGKRFVMAGLPYTPNVSGASALFLMNQPSAAASFLEFDRSSVELQNEPVDLRAVPPAFEAGEEISASVDLVNTGSVAQSATVKATLYRWSNIDNQPAVTESTATVNVSPTTPTAVPFTWDAAEAGAYELVYEVTNTPATQLGTRLKFRFSVAGVEPRIIFAGVTGIEGEQVKVTTCAVNASFSDGQGSLRTSVLGSNGQELASNDGTAQGSGLASNVLLVSKEAAAAGLQVTAETKDGQGNVSDSHTTTYSSALLASFIPTPTPTPEPVAAPSAGFSISPMMMGLIAAIVILILVGLGIYAWRKRASRALPPTSTLNPPTPPKL